MRFVVIGIGLAVKSKERNLLINGPAVFPICFAGKSGLFGEGWRCSRRYAGKPGSKGEGRGAVGARIAR